MALFFLCGVAALAPAAFFSATNGTVPGRSPEPFLIATVANPGTFFIAAMLLAVALAYVLRFVPAGMSFSFPRTISALLIGLLAYPIGFFSAFAQIFALFSLSRVDPPNTEPGVFGHVLGYLTLAGILFISSTLPMIIVTAAFAIGTRHWPRRAFGSILCAAGATVAGTVIAGIVHYCVEMAWSTPVAIQNALTHPLDVLLGYAWGVPLVVVVGEPLLAALLGHWFYLAAAEWSVEQA